MVLGLVVVSVTGGRRLLLHRLQPVPVLGEEDALVLHLAAAVLGIDAERPGARVGALGQELDAARQSFQRARRPWAAVCA